MNTLFVQIKCQLGESYGVAERIVDTLEDGKIYSTSGPFDLMAIFHLDGSIDPGVFVNERLHAISGIADTNTILAFNAFTPKGR